MRKNNTNFDFESLLGKEQDPPSRKVYRVNNSTLEKMIEIHKENPNGFLLFQDEIARVLAKINDFEKSAELRAFLLQGWGGKAGYSTDRIGRGSTHVEQVCVCLLGGTQPG